MNLAIATFIFTVFLLIICESAVTDVANENSKGIKSKVDNIIKTIPVYIGNEDTPDVESIKEFLKQKVKRDTTYASTTESDSIQNDSVPSLNVNNFISQIVPGKREDVIKGIDKLITDINFKIISTVHNSTNNGHPEVDRDEIKNAAIKEIEHIITPITTIVNTNLRKGPGLLSGGELRNSQKENELDEIKNTLTNYIDDLISKLWSHYSTETESTIIENYTEEPISTGSTKGNSDDLQESSTTNFEESTPSDIETDVSINEEFVSTANSQVDDSTVSGLEIDKSTEYTEEVTSQLTTPTPVEDSSRETISKTNEENIQNEEIDHTKSGSTEIAYESTVSTLIEKDHEEAANTPNEINSASTVNEFIASSTEGSSQEISDDDILDDLERAKTDQTNNISTERGEELPSNLITTSLKHIDETTITNLEETMESDNSASTNHEEFVSTTTSETSIQQSTATSSISSEDDLDTNSPTQTNSVSDLIDLVSTLTTPTEESTDRINLDAASTSQEPDEVNNASTNDLQRITTLLEAILRTLEKMSGAFFLNPESIELEHSKKIKEKRSTKFLELVPRSCADTSFPCPRIGNYRLDGSCTKFYECRFSKRCNKILSKIQTCPKCLKFNAQKMMCDFPENVPECTYPSSKNFCTGEGQFMVPDNCHKFYDCKKTANDTIELKLETCPTSMTFNKKHRKCLSKKVECSLANQVPKCTKKKDYFVDRFNCSKYYYCENDKVTELMCPLGFIFGGGRCQRWEEFQVKWEKRRSWFEKKDFM